VIAFSNAAAAREIILRRHGGLNWTELYVSAGSKCAPITAEPLLAALINDAFAAENGHHHQ
jgi:hypothetical protein